MTPEMFRFIESHKSAMVDHVDERGRDILVRSGECACGEPVTDFIEHWMAQAYRLGYQDRNREQDFSPRPPPPWYEID